MTQSYQLRDLGPIGAKIHNGKFGIIYALEWEPNLVFKRYIDTKKADEITLSALIDWPAGLSRAEQTLLQDSTAWPNALVWEGQHLVGITMPRAPERFTFRATDGKSRSATLSIAISQKRTHIRQQIPVPNQTQRLWLAYHLCRLLALFERYGIIYLDLSSKNILWSLDPKPAVFLVDCDSAFPVWRQNSAQSPRTGNFYDPWWRNPPSQEEVRGVFSLIFARLVFAKNYANFKSHIILEPPDNPFAKSFQAVVDDGYSPDFAQRPNFATWQAQIEMALGIAPDPLKKLLRYVPGATRQLQETKPSFIEKNGAGKVFIWAICLLIITIVGIKVQQKTLIERVWKNDNSIQCMLSSGGLRLYASGKEYYRNLRIDSTIDSGARTRHYIIRSDVVFWWDTPSTSNNYGYKRYIL